MYHKNFVLFANFINFIHLIKILLRSTKTSEFLQKNDGNDIFSVNRITVRRGTDPISILKKRVST